MPRTYYGKSSDYSARFNKEAMSAVHYDYNYPGGLDLTPDSEFHNSLLKKILERAQASKDVMQRRYRSWNAVDNTLTGFIPLSDEERMTKAKDSRKPVSIVVPMSYAILDTLLTFLTKAFLDGPVFKYSGRGPEDTIGATLLEKVINAQTVRTKTAEALYYMFRDSMVYGVGAVSTYWCQEWGTTVRKRPQRVATGVNQTEVINVRSAQRSLLYEGTVTQNIDPYLYFPDPTVTPSNIQKAEFVAWVARTNYPNLYNEELSSDGGLFNCRYVGHIDARSSLFRDEQGRYNYYDRCGEEMVAETDATIRDDVNQVTHQADIIYMCVNLIPEEWDLGPGTTPEKWIFAVAGDSVIIKANKLNLNHNLFPVAVNCPDSDGHSVSPISRLEMLIPMQKSLDFMFNSHNINKRKAINDMFVVDPQKINMSTLENTEPGKLITLKQGAWGTDVRSAISQLQVQDVTANNITDAGFIMQIMERVTGADGTLQGVMRTSGERISAAHSTDARNAALSRLGKCMRLSSMQAMYDLAYIHASNVQQFMSSGMWVKMLGDLPKELAAEYGKPNQMVTPDDISVDYDIEPYDSSIESGDFAQEWVQLYQVLAKDQQLRQGFDMPRIFKHIARYMGAKNVEDFVIQVTPDQQVQQQVEAGNVQPIPQDLPGQFGGNMGGY